MAFSLQLHVVDRLSDEYNFTIDIISTERQGSD